jgi:hypothetical protein
MSLMCLMLYTAWTRDSFLRSNLFLAYRTLLFLTFLHELPTLEANIEFNVEHKLYPFTVTVSVN